MWLRESCCALWALFDVIFCYLVTDVLIYFHTLQQRWIIVSFLPEAYDKYREEAMKVVLQNNKEKHQRSPCSLIYMYYCTNYMGMNCCT